MNLLLIEPGELVAADEAVITGRRVTHVREVIKAQSGDVLRAGVVDGLMGSAEILESSETRLHLRISLAEAPPDPLPVTLLLALPRPKMLKRIFQTIATMGVKRLVLLNSYRVEKSYWDSPWLKPEAIREQLITGLEQGRDTVVPQVILEPRFKPFVEDRLPELMQGSRGLIAHPVAAVECPRALRGSVTLAIGPEGGFIPYEIEQFTLQGFEAVSLGPRILRVETAVSALLARLF